MPLSPCSSCQRHVLATATHCPFCDAALPAARVAGARVSYGSLSRARQLAAAAAVALPLGACAASNSSGNGGGGSSNIAQPYGAPPNTAEPETDAATIATDPPSPSSVVDPSMIAPASGGPPRPQ